MDLAGQWSACTETCEKIYTVTIAQSGQGEACTIRNGAALQCEPGTDSCPEPGEVCTAGSGARDFYSGGADFDTATTVADLGAIECVAGNGRSRPQLLPMRFVLTMAASSSEAASQPLHRKLLPQPALRTAPRRCILSAHRQVVEATNARTNTSTEPRVPPERTTVRWILTV